MWSDRSPCAGSFRLKRLKRTARDCFKDASEPCGERKTDAEKKEDHTQQGFAASLQFLLSQGLSKQMVVKSMIPVWCKKDVE